MVFGGLAAQSFGPDSRLWPFSGIAALGLLLFSAGLLVVACCKQPQERSRALGLLCFLAGIGAIALGIGWGRAWRGLDYVFLSRYLAFAAPGLCCVYLIGVLYGVATSGRLLQHFLLLTTLLFINDNMSIGLHCSSENRSFYEKTFARDIVAGMPTNVLADLTQRD